MNKDKLRVAIIAVIVVAAVVGALLHLKIEPAGPAADSPAPTASEEVSSNPSQKDENEPILDISEPNTTQNPEEDKTGEEETAMTTSTPEPTQNLPETDPDSPSERPETAPDSTQTGSDSPSNRPDPTPEPTQTQPASTPEPTPTSTALTCTVEIRCDTVTDTSVVENEAVIPYIPADGVVLAETTVEFEQGETAFDILKRVCREQNVQMEFRADGGYSGYYIEGINYLYEFDAGALSGWMYKVNEKFPNYGCGRYEMQDGDKMVWLYTCDLGRDVGDNSEW